MKLPKLATSVAVIMTLVGLTLTSAANARGVIDFGVIKGITTAGSSAYLIVGETNSRAVSGETIPACATDVRSMSLSTNDKANLALLLTASASGQRVQLIGRGSCDEVGSIESIGFIRIDTGN